MIDVDTVDIEFTATDQLVPDVKTPSLKQKAIAEVLPVDKPAEVTPKSEDGILKAEKTKDIVSSDVTPQVAQNAVEGEGSDSMNLEGSYSGVQAQKVQMSYSQYLVAYIRKYKTYPRIAERLKQHGMVHAKIVITKDGHLKEVTVDKSSGFSSLDQGAMNLIKSLEPFKPLPETMKDEYSVIIPIEYTIAG